MDHAGTALSSRRKELLSAGHLQHSLLGAPPSSSGAAPETWHAGAGKPIISIASVPEEVRSTTN